MSFCEVQCPMEEKQVANISVSLSINFVSQFSKSFPKGWKVHLKVHLHAPSTFPNNLKSLTRYFSEKTIFSRDRKRDVKPI